MNLRKPLRKLKRRNRGFTLVEMVVVLSVLAIMAAVSVAYIIGYAENKKFNVANENAEILFTAAQNQLADYSTTGQLKELRDKLDPNGDGVYVDDQANGMRVINDILGQMKNEDGQSYDRDKVWANANKTEEQIVSITVEKGDYEKYLKITDTNDQGLSTPKQVLFEILGNYTFNTELLNASITLEFTPSDGQVFGVCYNSEIKHLVYALTDAARDGLASDEADVSNRQPKERKNGAGKLTGYYGVDTLSRAIKSKSKEEIAFTNVNLYNEDTLNLEFEVTGDQAAPSEIPYTIDFYNKDASLTFEDGTTPVPTDQPIYRLVFNTKTDTTDPTLARKASMTKLVFSASAERYDKDQGKLVPVTGSFLLPAWEVNEGSGNVVIHVVLDAVDHNATSFDYQKDIKSIFSKDGATKAFGTTYSVFRFGLASDYIACKVSSEGTDVYAAVEESSESNSESIAFDTVTRNANVTDDDGNTVSGAVRYTITNARHLNNVRFVEDYRYRNLQTGEMENHSPVTVFELTSTVQGLRHNTSLKKNEDSGYKAGTGEEETMYIDWGLLKSAGNYFDSKTKDFQPQDKKNEKAFVSFAKLNYGDYFESTGNKNPVTITNLTIWKNENQVNNLYIGTTLKKEYDAWKSANTNGGTFKYTDAYEEKMPTGLFLENGGEIRNVGLDQIKVIGNQNVGAFAGINGNRMKNLVLGKTTEEITDATSGKKYEKSTSEILGEKNVGGFAGSFTPVLEVFDYWNHIHNKTVSVEGLENYATVRGLYFVGGITGKAMTNWDDQVSFTKIKIEKCINNGEVGRRTEDKDERGYFFGGIIGYAGHIQASNDTYVTIKECEFLYEDEAEISEKLISAYDKADEQPADKTKVFKTHEGFENTFVGGIAGCTNCTAIVGCKVGNELADDEVSKTYILGDNYVGGIVGYQMTFSNQNGTKDDENKVYANVIGRDYVGGIFGITAISFKDGKTVDFSKKDFSDLQPTESNYGNLIVSGYSCHGMVFAMDAYAGGIVGLFYYKDAGDLHFEQNPEVKKKAEALFKPLIDDEKVLGNYTGGLFGFSYAQEYVYGDKESTIDANLYGGDYVGGVVGYNHSKPQSGKTIAKVHLKGTTTDKMVVYGLNFVGGIAGGMDAGAVLEDGVVENTTIVAKNAFAGGYYGYLNKDSSENHLRKYNVKNGVSVTATYFAGGHFGGLFANTVLYFDGQNYFGTDESTIDNTITATKAFAGGMTGFFMMRDSAVDKELVESLATKVDGLNETNAVLAVDKFCVDNPVPTWNINWSADSYLIKASEIKAGVYAGGFIGYVHGGQTLSINNVKNNVQITTTSTISNNDLHILSSDRTDANFSFIGVVAGKITKNMCVTWCSNGVPFKTQGSFIGGLGEINEGTIGQYRVSKYERDASNPYVGGVIGLNLGYIGFNPNIYQSERIEFNSPAIVTGEKEAGAIAAENYGLIYTVKFSVGVGESINVNVTANNGIAGGLVAVNGGTITNINNVWVDGKQMNFFVAGTVTGTTDVGGLVGQNIGSGALDFENVYVTATVTSSSGNAGGFIGTLAATPSGTGISNATNHGYVKGVNAGGIVGATTSDVASKFYVENCINTGIVRSTDDVNRATNEAGIIVSSNGQAFIKECRNYAPNVKNGITASNALAIEHCLDMNTGSVNSHFGNATSGKLYNFYIEMTGMRYDAGNGWVNFLPYTESSTSGVNTGLTAQQAADQTWDSGTIGQTIDYYQSGQVQNTAEIGLPLLAMSSGKYALIWGNSPTLLNNIETDLTVADGPYLREGADGSTDSSRSFSKNSIRYRLYLTLEQKTGAPATSTWSYPNFIQQFKNKHAAIVEGASLEEEPEETSAIVEYSDGSTPVDRTTVQSNKVVSFYDPTATPTDASASDY